MCQTCPCLRALVTFRHEQQQTRLTGIACLKVLAHVHVPHACARLRWQRSCSILSLLKYEHVHGRDSRQRKNVPERKTCRGKNVPERKTVATDRPFVMNL